MSTGTVFEGQTEEELLAECEVHLDNLLAPLAEQAQFHLSKFEWARRKWLESGQEKGENYF
jgi:hypothetical protein